MKARTKPRTFHVDEADLETIQYSDPSQENIFAGQSILKAANEVFDFDKFKKEQAEALDEMKKQQIDNELFVNESMLAAVNKVLTSTSLKNSRQMLLENLNNSKQIEK